MSHLSASDDSYTTADAHISIPLGIFIGLLASFVQSLGLTIQRKSHVVNEGLPEGERKVEHRRPLWLVGFLIFISSNILGSLVQIASLPVVILAPLGAVSLLWNAFFARLILGDVFSPWMVLGTILIAGGAVLIAIFGIVPEQTRSLEDLLELFRRPGFVAYFSVLGVAVAICLVLTHIVEFTVSRRLKQEAANAPPIPADPENPPPTALTTGLTVNVAHEAADERTALLDPKSSSASSYAESVSSRHSIELDKKTRRLRVFLAISYASISGILSGMCLLFAKSGVELLMLTIQGDNQFWRWEAWILVLALGIFALLQLWYLHKALILADPTLVCPSAFCFYNLSSIVNGLVYYDQFALIAPWHLVLVAVGMVILLGGVWVVSIQSADKGADDEIWSGSESDDEEPLINLDDDIEHGQDARDSMRLQETASPDQLVDTSIPGEPDTGEGERRGSTSSTGPSTLRSHNLRLSIPPRPPRTSFSNAPPPSAPQHSSAHGGISPTPMSPPVERPSRSRHRPSLDYGGLGSPSFRPSRETRVSSHSSHSRTLSPPPMMPGISGFSIGLSAMSPGFSLVPTDNVHERSSHIGHRKRRQTEHGDAIGAMSHSISMGHSTDVTGPGEGRRRRTVSEGDVQGQLDELPVPGTDVQASAPDAAVSDTEDSTDRLNKGKGRSGDEGPGGASKDSDGSWFGKLFKR
ncbi:hypothetical protein BD626DRAFT_397565 [Schizophyllum amplum]|uniref:Magnesium transporter NIPA-domain-containing protein n=1 Tax=Schizophyllum amplum TaxID=97359 RepID=A0A550CNB3_9AGAR|nr:hypothetical protein BD626DRAFT_397565 [Auriculariopsis ampla]